jgi:hypothetical protein
VLCMLEGVVSGEIRRYSSGEFLGWEEVVSCRGVSCRGVSCRVVCADLERRIMAG